MVLHFLSQLPCQVEILSASGGEQSDSHRPHRPQKSLPDIGRPKTEMQSVPQISDPKSDQLYYSVHPKPLCFEFLTRELCQELLNSSPQDRGLRKEAWERRWRDRERNKAIRGWMWAQRSHFCILLDRQQSPGSISSRTF